MPAIFPSFCFVSPSSSSFPLFLSQVEDVNDNAPLTSDPIYHPVVMENSPKDVSVIRIQAQDPDLTATPSRLSYRITAGNPQNFFSINPKTGETHKQTRNFKYFRFLGNINGSIML